MSSRQKQSNTKPSLVPIVLSVAALVVAIYALSQKTSSTSIKVGFVKSGLLMEKAEISAEARQKLQVEQDEVAQNIKSLEEKLASNHEAFIAEQAEMTPDDRKKRIEELGREEEDLYRYRQAATQKMQAREQELFEPVFNIINARIGRYAKQEGYTMIWGTLREGNILYGTEATDITDEVIAYINSQK